MSHREHLLVIAAMEEEEAALLRELGATEPARPVGSRLTLAVHRREVAETRSVSVVRSGMGNVNAALTLAVYAEHRPIDAVVLLGVGGALRADLDIGQLVVATGVLQHDYFASLDFGHPRMRAGEIVLTEAQAREHAAVHATDAALSARLVGRPHSTAGLPVRQGIVLSGNEFVGTVARKQAVAELHGEGLLVEMEAAGIAQVARRLGIPFAVAKTVADRLRPDGTIEADFRRCLDRAARNAADVLRHLLG